jgi:ribosomal protein S18 acetylase RimI-like enzyme
MKQIIADAAEWGEREIALEVIEQNEPAVKLYQKCGFETIRRLVGYIHTGRGTANIEDGEPYRFDLREMGRLISQYGLADLPWQLSGESVTQISPPPYAYCHGPAYIVISNPEAEHVVIWSLLVEPEARGNGLGTQMLQRVMAYHEGKTWHVPAIFPEELGKVFERAGFEREKLSQWQMKLEL